MSCFVSSMQYPNSACGLLSKKQYAASAAIILIMKLFTDLCLECTSCAVFLSMSLIISTIHFLRSMILSHIGMSLSRTDTKYCYFNHSHESRMLWRLKKISPCFEDIFRDIRIGKSPRDIQLNYSPYTLMYMRIMHS